MVRRGTRAWGGVCAAAVMVAVARGAAAQTAQLAVVNDWGNGFQAEVRIDNPGAALSGWRAELNLAAAITSIWNAQVESHSGTRYVLRGAPWNADLPAGGSLSFGFVAAPGHPSLPVAITVRGATSPAATATRTAAAATVTRTPSRTATRAATPTSAPPTATRTATAAAPSATRTPTPTAVAATPTRTAIAATATRTLTATRPPATLTPTATAIPAAGVAVTFARTASWDGGYNAEIRITNTGAAPITAWELRFDLADQIGTLWNGRLQGAAPHYAVLNESWNGVIAAGSSVAIGFGATAQGLANVPAACVFNGSGCAFQAAPPPTSTPGPGGVIQIGGVDQPLVPALQITVAQGTTDLSLSLAGGGAGTYSVACNEPRIARPTIVGGSTLRISASAAGRAGLRISEATSGAVRYVGVRVREADGALPGLPRQLAVGSVSEDTGADLALWRGFGDGLRNTRVDVRYIYLNGGPFGGWYDWQGGSGNRAASYIRESRTLGMIPFFVFYNIPDAGESYATDLAHIQDEAYMTAYWDNLRKALDIIVREGGDDTVGLVLEPDFIGYMMQLSGRQPAQIAAVVHTVYDSGILHRGSDPSFPDSLVGLVQAVNYLIATRAPNAVFGWQFNLWASLSDGSGIPASGLMRITDSLGLAAGRSRVALEAQRIADYYLAAGVASYGADFVSIDKYGLDGGFAGAAAPWSSTWFWNAVHWNNYLLFTRGLHERTALPVVLWQLPVGHVNHSLAFNPYTPDGLFPSLTNTTNRYEDSAPSFFFGDRFDTRGDAQRLAYFGQADPDEPGAVSTAGGVVEWREHLGAARDAGVIAALFGDGVGESTRGRGAPPPDGYWWIVKTQAALQSLPR